MHVVFATAVVLSGISSLITTLQTAATVLFRRRGRFFGPGPRVRSGSSGPFRPGAFSLQRPSVSILKPICGVESNLEADLESFAALRGVDYEVILSVADPRDAALPIVQRVMGRHPSVAWRLVTGGDPGLEKGNRKVARLIAAMSHARGDILFISDSNVSVQPDDIAQTLSAFEDPNTGCVSNLFTGAGSDSFGASIESLHLLSFVVPGMVTAAAVRVPCVVGKSMAIRRNVLQTIGGFDAFWRVLAEDQAIGLAVRKAGYAVVLSPVVIRNSIKRRTVAQALDRQIRWNKIRYAFSRSTYCAEALLFPLPFAVIAALAQPTAFALPVAVMLLRMTQIATLSRAVGANSSVQDLLCVPVFDLLHFAGQFAPYLDDRVTWRGYSTRLGPHTLLIDITEKRAA